MRVSVRVRMRVPPHTNARIERGATGAIVLTLPTLSLRFFFTHCCVAPSFRARIHPRGTRRARRRRRGPIGEGACVDLRALLVAPPSAGVCCVPGAGRVRGPYLSLIWPLSKPYLDPYLTPTGAGRVRGGSDRGARPAGEGACADVVAL